MAADDKRRPARRAGSFPDHLFEAAEERFRELEEAARRVTADPKLVEALGDQPFAAIPCPACEGVNRFRLADPPRPHACSRCGEPIDPREPFEVRMRTVDRVIGGTTAALVLFVTKEGHPLNALMGLLGPALNLSRGRFVVARIDAGAEPEVLGHLEVGSAPAIIFHQGGQRMGALSLPSGLAGMADGMRQWLGRMIGGAATGRTLPFPFPQEGADSSEGAGR